MSPWINIFAFILLIVFKYCLPTNIVLFVCSPLVSANSRDHKSFNNIDSKYLNPEKLTRGEEIVKESIILQIIITEENYQGVSHHPRSPPHLRLQLHPVVVVVVQVAVAFQMKTTLLIITYVLHLAMLLKTIPNESNSLGLLQEVSKILFAIISIK